MRQFHFHDPVLCCVCSRCRGSSSPDFWIFIWPYHLPQPPHVLSLHIIFYSVTRIREGTNPASVLVSVGKAFCLQLLCSRVIPKYNFRDVMRNILTTSEDPCHTALSCGTRTVIRAWPSLRSHSVSRRSLDTAHFCGAGVVVEVIQPSRGILYRAGCAATSVVILGTGRSGRGSQSRNSLHFFC